MSNNDMMNTNADIAESSSGFFGNFFNLDTSPTLKKVRWAYKGGKFLANQFEKLLDVYEEHHRHEPLGIGRFLQDISPAIDKVLLDTAENKGYIPLGGEVFLSIEPKSGNVLVAWEFYFLEKMYSGQEKYHKQSAKNVFKKEFFTNEALEDIDINSPKYSIEAPE